MTKQKLELTWIGKENRPRLEPRILVEDPEKSYRAHIPSLKRNAPTPVPSQEGITPGQAQGKSEVLKKVQHDIFDNRLIFGDNLLALKALEQEFAGKIKCIFIDPPYNTGSAFEHYDDGIEHSLWLSLMRDRLELLKALLSEDGSIWITIDDNEVHYLKIICDELFGRQNFVASIIWEKADSPRNSARQFSIDHDYVLVYSRHPSWVPLRLPRTEEANSIYSNPDNDPRGPWLPGDPYANKPYARGRYSVLGPTGREFSPPPGRYWRISEERLRALDADGRVWWGPKGDARPSIKRYLNEVSDLVARTLWRKDEVGSNRTSKNEMRALFPGESSFGTPKPEKLLQRILHIASSPNDWVLDSFAGSGTTGAVAHKMGRRWIMVELGEHCHTHIIPRMKKVIDGTDPGGITKVVDWKGGGGFRYFRLAPSLLEKDKWGNWVISKEYNATMLANAMAKHEGFVYSPDETFYWKQGKSTEKDYIFTTTNFITVEYLDSIHEEMQPDESLLICCKSFQEACESRYENITVKKIPNMLLGRCEFGKEDYSLSVSESPSIPDDDVYGDMTNVDTSAKTKKMKSTSKSQPGLFDNKEDDNDE